MSNAIKVDADFNTIRRIAKKIYNVDTAPKPDTESAPASVDIIFIGNSES
jgi:hypothetical protein